MLVEPKGGLPKVDREYYVMKGEFYTAGRTLAAGLQPFDFDKLWDERPSYVVWNGAYDALRGKHALRAHVNDTVRLYVGNGGPNLITSFHVVGGIFDRVYPEGGDTAQGGMTERDVQTTQVPSGGATIVELKLHKGGAYWLVDHSYSRLPKGIIGELNADEPGATREPTASEGRAPHQAAAAIASVESAPRPLPWARSGVACHAKGRNAIGLRLTANGLP
ncbi:MAG TPA: nitrite reductase, copper-containing, partial [bacterium]